jgi:hypothetical protein
MLAYAGVCWRMLAYAGVCGCMLAHADVCYVWRTSGPSPLARPVGRLIAGDIFEVKSTFEYDGMCLQLRGSVADVC